MHSSTELICFKGLAKLGGLILHIQNRLEHAPGDQILTPAHRELLRRNDIVIREAFNERHAAIPAAETFDREKEIAARAALLTFIYDVYYVGWRLAPPQARSELRAADVVALLVTLRRLSLSCRFDYAELATHCERAALLEALPRAHIDDPLQARHVLTFHPEELFSNTVAALQEACAQGDRVAIRQWFQDWQKTNGCIPKAATQLLRSIVWNLAKEGSPHVALVAFELAAVDTRVSEEIGWQAAREFCSLMARVFRERYLWDLEPYLEADEISAAILACERVGDRTGASRLRALAEAHHPKSRADLRRSVDAAALKYAAREQPRVAAPERLPRTRPHFLLRAFGLA